MVNKPILSVLTSCYNAAPYLHEAVTSILQQTFADFEYILIDDGSTDGTTEILQKYSLVDGRIRVISKPNTGLASSLNVGLCEARGQWVARLDADDAAMPQRFQEQLSFLSCHPDTIVLGTGCIEITSTGIPIKKHRYPSHKRPFLSHLLGGKSPFPHSSAVFNKSAVTGLDGYRVRLNGAEDVDLWLRLSEYGEVRCLSQPLVRLRRHNGSITAKNEKLMILSTAAKVSYQLRLSKHSDPVAAEDVLYNHFLEWLYLRLMNDGCLARRQFWLELRATSTGGLGRSRVGRTFRILQQVLQSRYRMQLLYDRLFSSNYVLDLANDWIAAQRYPAET